MTAKSEARPPTNVWHWLLSSTLAAVLVIALWFAAAVVHFGWSTCGTPVDQSAVHQGQTFIALIAAAATLPWLVASILTRGRAPVVLGALVCGGYATYLVVQSLDTLTWTQGLCF